jgi:hypothetical protein
MLATNVSLSKNPRFVFKNRKTCLIGSYKRAFNYLLQKMGLDLILNSGFLNGLKIPF